MTELSEKTLEILATEIAVIRARDGVYRYPRYFQARLDNMALSPLTDHMKILDASMYRLDRERRFAEQQEAFVAGSVLGAIHRHANRRTK